MVAYQIYWSDEEEKTHFIGILPERRKNPGRITPESILNWGRTLVGDRSNLEGIYFVQVEFWQHKGKPVSHVISEGRIRNVFPMLSKPITVTSVVRGYLWGGTE
jgi:hypothetical protein